MKPTRVNVEVASKIYIYKKYNILIPFHFGIEVNFIRAFDNDSKRSIIKATTPRASFIILYFKII